MVARSGVHSVRMSYNGFRKELQGAIGDHDLGAFAVLVRVEQVNAQPVTPRSAAINRQRQFLCR